MSKKLILLAVIVCIIGVAIGFYYGLSPFYTLMSYAKEPSKIAELVKTLPQTVLQNLATVIASVSSVVGTLFLAARSYSLQKQRSTETIKALEVESSEKISSLTTEKQAAETKLQETTKTYSDNFATLSTNYNELQSDFEEAKIANKQLIADRDHWKREYQKLEAEKQQTYVK